ncbi:Prolyl tripeptidyl peptidase precursor [Posidoniimonas polymericola]|uniref:Prolyl tripeptidyl peptidase n=1 Tax=Posidoniimonas polymericola TaxID=2528002 RepID=A0A5C5YSH9_9BACT|nr:S9 family peptidase [Posidoniimonas polymericola]TWT77964.1 Prolyl tripeptidyl peptidase precursor [Posidoniimonas polymericola]
MLRKFCFMAAELGLFFALLSVAVSGCSKPSDSGSYPANADDAPAFDPKADTPVDPGNDGAKVQPIPNADADDPDVQPIPNATGTPPVTETKAQEAPMADRMSDVPLIPRETLFGDPERAQARLSPDGKWLSFMAPVKNDDGFGILNVWVAPVDNLDAAEPVTKDTKRPIGSHSWAYDSKHILYNQDKEGDENFHLYATNVETKETKDLTPIDGVRGELQEASDKFPGELLVGFNDRNPQLHDIYRVNIATGDRKLVQLNPGMVEQGFVAGFLTDDDFNVRMAIAFSQTGGQVWLTPTGEPGEGGYGEDAWEQSEEFTAIDAMTSGPAGFDKTNRVLYFQDSRDRDTSAQFSKNLDAGNVELIADDPRADVGGVLAHPTKKTLQAVSFTYSRREWKVLDPSIQADIDYLTDFQDGEFIVTSRTQDDAQWTVAYILDNGPVKFYRYTRPADGGASSAEGAGDRKMHFLFNNRDDLDDYPLVKMHTPVIKSRDGLNLVSYLSLPPGTDPDGDGVPDQPVPLVLDVHGGPWARDGWGLNASHQWLANRGYAVLNVNYRGSTGFGKNFINAANGEWSGKMHDDLLDAVKWAVGEGIAQEDKIAIMGGSYGGYATLVGMTYTPTTFACGVDIVGPSSLVTLLENAPPYWASFMPVMKIRVGDWTTEEGKAELLKKSPLSLVDKIERPLLIGQGANDPRVTQVEADQIVAAMEEKQIPVTYVLYPDEGHGFHRPPNRKSFNAVTEAFLAENLGGRFEPIGPAFDGASIRVPVGADEVPGLKDELSEEQMTMPEVE